MIWVIAAVGLGLFLGVLGFYFSKMINVLSFGVIGLGFRAIDTMGSFPEHIQLAIVVFVVSFFCARIFTWIYVKKFRKTKSENKAARKKRILKEYGYKKMPDMF